MFVWKLKETEPMYLSMTKKSLRLKFSSFIMEIAKVELSLNSPANGSAYFSNLSYTATEDIEFELPPVPDYPIGLNYRTGKFPGLLQQLMLRWIKRQKNRD